MTIEIGQHFKTFEEMARMNGTSVEFQIIGLLARLEITADSSKKKSMLEEIRPRFEALARMAREQAAAAGVSRADQVAALFDGMAGAAANEAQRRIVTNLRATYAA